MTAPTPLELEPRTTYALDLLRGLAAQAVLLGHAFDFFNVFSFLGHPDPPPQIQRLAVVLFFLLSGFLIARSLHRASLERRSGAFSRFLARRARRITWGLAPALLLIAVVDRMPFDLFELDYFEGDERLLVALANLVHLQNYPGTGLPVFGSGEPLWTLSIEWWLYVFAGVVALGRAGGRWSVLALLLALPAAGSVTVNLLGGPGHGIAATWLYGALTYVAVLRGGRTEHPAPAGLWLAGGLLASAFAVARFATLDASHPMKAFDRPAAVLLAVAFACFIGWCQASSGPPREVPEVGRRLAHFLASYSYTLYLTHFTLLTVLYEARGSVDDRLLLVTALVACNLVAAGWSRLGEARGQPRRSHVGSPLQPGDAHHG